MNELKNCPFCGRKANMVISPMTKMVAFNCKCSSVIFYGAERDVERSAKMWNRRAETAEDDDRK